MGRRMMVEGRVATLIMDEAANRARFTLEGDVTPYDATMQYACFLRMPGAYVRFYHEDAIAGVTLAENPKFGGIPLPDDATLDAALHGSLRGEITAIAAVRRSPTLIEKCGENGSRLTGISERAQRLLDALDAVPDAKSDPSPSNPALLPIYRTMTMIGSEFRSVMTKGMLFAALATDEIVRAAVEDEDNERFREVIRIHYALIDPESLPARRFIAREALRAFEASGRSIS